MIYRPDLDINKAEISSDASFIYVTIYLNGLNPASGNLQGLYGVELDSDLDGRGNYLVLASNPAGSDWKMENVTVYKDTGKKVGGPRPMISDAVNDYTGYDQEILSLTNLADPDLAWARVSPKGAAMVEVAFKKGLTMGSAIFLWNVWADDGVKDPKKFDYNDHFTASDAGSPYQDANYPLKALAQMDNTCREVWGFTPTADIPGLCFVPPTATPVPTLTKTPTKVPAPGKITGSVYADNNNNGRKDSGEGPFCHGVSIVIMPGSCAQGLPGTGVTLNASCQFSSGSLPAGHYCVAADGNSFTSPSAYDVDVPAGGSRSVSFGISVPG
jgi:hypothetical protein